MRSSHPTWRRPLPGITSGQPRPMAALAPEEDEDRSFDFNVIGALLAIAVLTLVGPFYTNTASPKARDLVSTIFMAPKPPQGGTDIRWPEAKEPGTPGESRHYVLRPELLDFSMFLSMMLMTHAVFMQAELHRHLLGFSCTRLTAALAAQALA